MQWICQMSSRSATDVECHLQDLARKWDCLQQSSCNEILPNKTLASHLTCSTIHRLPTHSLTLKKHTISSLLIPAHSLPFQTSMLGPSSCPQNSLHNTMFFLSVIILFYFKPAVNLFYLNLINAMYQWPTQRLQQGGKPWHLFLESCFRKTGNWDHVWDINLLLCYTV